VAHIVNIVTTYWNSLIT